MIFAAEFLGKYTVRYKAYDVNGDEITLDGEDYQPKEYHNGDEVTVAPVLTHDEYTFNGWNVESPDDLTLTASGTFTMPESDVLLTGRFTDGVVPPPAVYTITYRSGLKDGDACYTEDLGTPHQFSVTAGADGKANHTVFANDAPELKYVRAGYTFSGWKLTKANPDPNPAPGGKGTVVAPRAYAANGLIAGGEVIEVDSSIVLTARSGRAALKHRLSVNGVEVDEQKLDKIYEKFLQLADQKKEVNDADVLMLAGADTAEAHAVKLEFLQVTTGKGVKSVASIGLDISGQKFEAAASGNGPVDAAIKALKKIIMKQMTLKEFTIQAISKGSDDVGKVHMQVEYDGSVYYGFGANTDIVTASVEAYIDCINKFKR